jgi:xanthine/CO dehydrogenase XdhC/CoxF family maturation factor
MSDILQELLEARRTGRPCALDIGADSPAEIAVSVLAEILMVLREKSGRPLKL